MLKIRIIMILMFKAFHNIKFTIEVRLKENWALFIYYVALKTKFAGPHPPYVTLFFNMNSMVVTLSS